MRKLAVISSGTKGIGRATAEKFFFNGFDIVTCARSADDLLQLKEELEEKGEAEVSVPESVEEPKPEIEKQESDKTGLMARM